MNAMKKQLETIRERFRDGVLTEDDIQVAIEVADDGHVMPKQSLLYIQAASTHPHSAVMGISIYEDGKDPEGIDKDGNLLYRSIKEALDDGWRIIKFPEMVLAMDDQNNYGLGYEFILERWR
jgi:hypothetical protein